MLSIVVAFQVLILGSTQVVPSWKVDSIQNDLRCQKSAEAVLRERNHTGCSSTEIYNTIASVGTCTPCSAQPKGPGYYCESSQAVLCPNGYYCPDYLDKKVCPEGKWC